jgi:beta-lactamase class D
MWGRLVTCGRLVIGLIILLCPISAQNLAKFFKGYQACFSLLDESREHHIRYSPQRCAARVSPWSTFKIPNSLISLELGIVPDASEITKWDGVVRARPAWNRDQTLASAFAVSALWYYQRLARETGEQRMREYVHKIGYGNEDTSGGIDHFWLGSSLKISADEQVNFLHRLLKGRLPFSDRTVGILKEIMIVSKTDDSVLRGKTGMGGPDNARLNWFVGYLERGNRRYIFATNIEAANITDPLTARHITEQILHNLKLF